jgi:hypothetical protein
VAKFGIRDQKFGTGTGKIRRQSNRGDCVRYQNRRDNKLRFRLSRIDKVIDRDKVVRRLTSQGHSESVYYLISGRGEVKMTLSHVRVTDLVS